MIRIKKPLQPPDKLLQEGKRETENIIQLYESGHRKFEFNKDVYGGEPVKEALRKAQHGKCCFCERKEEIGDVEHFRPKGAFKQKDKDKLSETGYYWLAYEWDNLFYCCPKCNRSYKKNYFPLVDAFKRAMTHIDDISIEEPLIIHPGKDNPEEYIEFIGERPRAISGNSKGKETIKRTGIDRPFLDEQRFEKYKVCKAIYYLIHSTILEVERDKLIQLLEEYSQDSSEFSSMIRCALRHGFRY